MVFCNVVRLLHPAQTYIQMGGSFHLEMMLNSAVFSSVAVLVLILVVIVTVLAAFAIGEAQVSLQPRLGFNLARCL